MSQVSTSLPLATLAFRWLGPLCLHGGHVFLPTCFNTYCMLSNVNTLMILVSSLNPSAHASAVTTMQEAVSGWAVLFGHTTILSFFLLMCFSDILVHDCVTPIVHHACFHKGLVDECMPSTSIATHTCCMPRLFFVSPAMSSCLQVHVKLFSNRGRCKYVKFNTHDSLMFTTFATTLPCPILDLCACAVFVPPTFTPMWIVAKISRRAILFGLAYD